MAANNLLTISMITNEALRVLQNQLVFTRAVSRQYDDKFAIEGAKIGTTINLRKPPRYVGRTGAVLQIESSVETNVPLTLDTQFGVDMAFTTQDLTLNISDFSDRFIKPAVAAIANKIDYDGLQQFYNIFNMVSTPGQLTDGATTQAEATASILAARARLNQMAAPVDDERHFVVDPTVEVGIVSGLTNFFNPQGTISRIFQKGALGDSTLGFNFAMDQNVGNFTAGTFRVGTDSMTTKSGGEAGGSVQNNAQTGFTMTATITNTYTLTKGTVFTIPGVYAVNPQNRQSTGSLMNFTVTSTVTGTGSPQSVSIFPVPVFSGQFQNVTSSTGAIPSSQACTIISGSAGASYPNALAFHKDAFALGTADLILPQGVDMAGRASADGLSIRLVRQYDINSDQLPCRLDVLYGWSTVYPELAVRVSG